MKYEIEHEIHENEIGKDTLSFIKWPGTKWFMFQTISQLDMMMGPI